MVKVKGIAKLSLPDKDVRFRFCLADYLSPEVSAVTVNNDGLLTENSTVPNKDDIIFLAYLLFSITPSLFNCCVIQSSNLQEPGRLGRGVGISVYKNVKYRIIG